MARAKRNPYLLSFYGDDFTGTASTAEALTMSGIPTIIFVKPPTAQFLRNHFPKVHAIGVAGISRSLPTENLAKVLDPTFQRMKTYGAPLVLYKVCSTFDSSPEIGNIGKAIEIGLNVFSSKFVPILAAAPRFGRFTLFGNHFVALGEEVFRLDRHPSISVHPVTPMQESDLRRHLAKQTHLNCSLIPILALIKGREEVRKQVEDRLGKNISLILFDTFSKAQLNSVCSVVWNYAEDGKTLFCVGSQEWGYGLAEEWRRLGILRFKLDTKPAGHSGKGGPLLVVSGSCAAIAGRQVEWAAAHHYTEIGIRTETLFDDIHRKREMDRVAQEAISSLKSGKSVVIHSAIGPSDPRISNTKELVENLGMTSQNTVDVLGQALGELARKIILASIVRRLILSGGDTAGRITQTLGIWALQVGRSVGVPAPLCYVYSTSPEMNGLQVAYKGGQVGGDDYFDQVRRKEMPDFNQVAVGPIQNKKG
jgi:3-oxoisoapionate kinase